MADISDFSPTPPPRRATLKDIALRTGVSVNTVSAVLNPRRRHVYISAETRARVEAAARDLHYARNLTASRLAGGRNRLIGVITPKPLTPGDALLLTAFETQVARRGYACMMFGAAGADPAAASARCIGYSPAAVLVLRLPDSVPARAALESLFLPGLPGIVCDVASELAAVPTVCANDHLGGQLIAQHLINQGHRSFAFLSAEADLVLRSVRDVIDGAQNILEHHGFVAPFEGFAVPVGPPELVAQPFIERLRAGTAPAAVICTSDVVALRLIRGLTLAGYQVPRHMAVTGYGDLTQSWADESALPADGAWPWGPGLTTVRLPWARLAEYAADLLLAHLEEERPLPPGRHVIEVELITRGSSRAKDFAPI